MFEFFTNLFTPVLILFGFTAPVPEPIPVEPMPIIEQTQETMVTPTTSTSVELGPSVVPKPQPVAQTPPVVTIAPEPTPVTEEAIPEIIESNTPSEVPTKPLATPSTTTAEEIVHEPVCGNIHKETLSSVPANNLCAIGQVANDDLDESIYSWQCISEDAETDCKAFITTHGACGVSDNVLLHQSYSSDVFCSAGELQSKQADYGKLSWTCQGQYDGYDAYCSAQVASHGVCGASNESTFSTFPATNLCQHGEPLHKQTSTEIFTWQCSGINNGSSASCQAVKDEPVPIEINPDCIPSGGLMVPIPGCIY